MLIRPLDPGLDLTALIELYREAADYWILAEGKIDPAQKAAEFFTDCPPNCDPAASHRLGLFADGHLGGVAELSFGFPEPQDAYLGLMLLAPRVRGVGAGQTFFTHVETLARAAKAPRLYLAVLEANPRGRTFWERMGFRATNLSRVDNDAGLNHIVHRLVKPL